MRIPLRAIWIAMFAPAVLLAGEQQPRRLILHSVEKEIVVDGRIDDAWSTADSATDFIELSPYYGKPSSRKTVAKVLTTRDALYCLMVCYDRRDSIQQITGVLDQGNGDIVSIMLDTFDDKQSAYKFAVTASGVRSDARLLDDARNRDYSWDGVWYAATSVEEWGFVVEMKIPFRSIRFNADLTEWGLDFDRWIASLKEDTYWCRYEQHEGQRISKFGRLVLNGARPDVEGLNLEVYPVAIAKATRQPDGSTKLDPDAGIDVFYNPSERLTFQLTGNPDFAQIEADPYTFNITRYETYFEERRPFFTEGSEIFMASGREHNSGFYSPLELFYSRRIGKILSDGSRVPLNLGTKVFGRVPGLEYGGFFALTGPTDYTADTGRTTEARAYFGSVRLKKQIFENSSVGLLAVGKWSDHALDGVVDIDGAFRTTGWQLAYQLARSVKDGGGDFAGSAGFRKEDPGWLSAVRFRGIGKSFDVDQVGFVPWRGTVELTAISGPVWRYDEGALQSMLLGAGGEVYYKDVELDYDRYGIIIINMEFRSNWGYEIDLVYGHAKDQGVPYPSWSASLSTWYDVSPRWDANLNCAIERSYNFVRNFLALDGYVSPRISWKVLDVLEVGTSGGVFIEGNPAGATEEVTYNARPYFSLTPLNDLNIRMYVDNLFLRSSNRLEHVIMGLLFSYNFLPKSWIYLAINETQGLIDGQMQTTDRAAVLKVKYLYFF